MAPSGLNRVLPVVGFSLSELDDAGINLELAERLGLTHWMRRAWACTVPTFRHCAILCALPGNSDKVRALSFPGCIPLLIQAKTGNFLVVGVCPGFGHIREAGEGVLALEAY